MNASNAAAQEMRAKSQDAHARREAEWPAACGYVSIEAMWDAHPERTHPSALPDGVPIATRVGAGCAITPIAYRLRLRSWAAPALALPNIAELVGFEDMPYSHRSFIAEFGVTPAVYGRRSKLAAVA